MAEFEIYNSKGKKTKLEINKVKLSLTDCARVDAKYQGLKVCDTLLTYGGGYTKPFIRFEKDNESYVDAVLTKEVIEYIWRQIGSPYTGLLYGFTENNRANWCD